MHLGETFSTISNKVSAGGCNRATYGATRAQKRARRTARKRKLWKRKILLLPQLRRYIHAKLRLRWSPEEIAHKIVEEYPDNMIMRVALETVYAYLYAFPRVSSRRNCWRACGVSGSDGTSGTVEKNPFSSGS